MSHMFLDNTLLEFIFVWYVVYVGCTGWIINLGFIIAHRVSVSDILFLVFHEKVIWATDSMRK